MKGFSGLRGESVALPQFSLTLSRNGFPGLKCGNRRADIESFSPVLGLRTCLASWARVVKLPKPRISIRPPDTSLGHLIEQGFDSHVEGGERQFWVDLGKPLNEVGSVHVGQCAPKG